MADISFGIIQLQARQNAKHAFVSAVSDGGDASLVRPSNWNAVHNVPSFPLLQIGGDTWTGMPASLTEYLGLAEHRVQADLTHVLSVRLVVSVLAYASAATAKLRAQYSTDLSGAGSWNYLDHVVGPNVTKLDTLAPQASTWVNIHASAQTDVLLRIVGIDG
jgi:hypothetical protein